MSIPAIVLAAGASTRLGRPKQLVAYLGETLLGRAVRLAKQAGADPVFAVLGAYSEAMLAEVQHASGRAVINAEWQQGIAGSIHAGLRAVEAVSHAAVGVLLLTCDQPKLTAAHLSTLLRSFTLQPDPIQNPSAPVEVIAASTYQGTLGTPAVFPRTLFPQLLALQGDAGARKILKAPPCPVAAIPLPGGEIDIDTPADLERLM
jgi:molybdenum cofactor cytidylyltransferase